MTINASLKLYLGLEFMRPSINNMVKDDPSDRPTIDECVIHLDEIVRSLSTWKLRSQVTHSTDNIFGYIYHIFPYRFPRITMLLDEYHLFQYKSVCNEIDLHHIFL